MLRRRPSIVTLAFGLAALVGWLWPFIETVPETRPVETPVFVSLVVLFLVCRPCVATVTALELNRRSRF